MEQTQNYQLKGDWREHSMNEALRAGAVDGSAVDALLRQLRLHNPGSATLIILPDKRQALRFLQDRASNFRSLLPGSIDFQQNTDVLPYLGWYAVEWEGSTCEVIMVPHNFLICIADDSRLLHRFGATLMDYAERPSGRCLCYSGGWRTAPDLDEEIGKVTWEDIVLPPDLLISIRDAVDGFLRHRDAFAELGFVWRRGILLIGPPGTGKTMVCKAAAASLKDLPFLYVRDLREGRDSRDALKLIFQRARKLTPCILAFEDIDGLIKDANRTVFLNELDGFQNNEGLLTIASSNHPGAVDEALLKRPSRFDRVFHLGLPELAERREFCLRLLSRSSLASRLSPAVRTEELSQQVAQASSGFTPAYLKEAFLAAGLQRAQQGAGILDEQFSEAVLHQVEELRQHLRRLRDPGSLAETPGGNGAIGFSR